MKSALPKVLHPLLGRTLLGHVLAAADAAAARHARSSWSATAPSRSTAHLAEVAPGRRHRSLQAEQRGTGHAVRIALEAVADARRHGRRAQRRRAAAARRDAGARWSRAHEAAGAAATVLTAEVRRPDRARPDRPRPRTAALERDRRGARRDRRRSARSARSTPASTRSTPRLLRAGAGQADHRQRPGRGVPHRRRRPARRGRARRSRAHRRRRRRRDARLQRPGRAGRRCGRCCATGSTTSWMRAGVTHRRPGDHLDRRHRDARAATR